MEMLIKMQQEGLLTAVEDYKVQENAYQSSKETIVKKKTLFKKSRK